eukprot:gene4634-20916_t
MAVTDCVMDVMSSGCTTAGRTVRLSSPSRALPAVVPAIRRVITASGDVRTPVARCDAPPQEVMDCIKSNGIDIASLKPSAPPSDADDAVSMMCDVYSKVQPCWDDIHDGVKQCMTPGVVEDHLHGLPVTQGAIDAA